ncbi:MAG: hypothetical protein JNK67_32180 [Alphaproteobacteria bacterium]|nr:hypothetical protein [Alphaproteobacteria bacterium]
MAALILLGMAGLAGGAVAFGIWFMRRMSRRIDSLIDAQQRGRAARGPARAPAAPIELLPARQISTSSTGWAIGLFVLGGSLLGTPDMLWTAWLSYPAGVFVLAIAAFCAVSAWFERQERITADAAGLRMRGRAGDIFAVRWADVGAVRLVERGSRAYRRADQPAPTRHLVLYGHDGGELRRLVTPLRPVARYTELLEAIEAWTGAPVVPAREP